MVPLPREGPPDELRFHDGEFAVGGVTVELQRSSVAMWRTPWNWQPGVAIDTVRAVPTEELQSFRTALGNLVREDL